MAQPEIPIDMDATCARLNPQPLTTRHYVVSPNGGLANVLVYVQEGLENRSYRVPNEPAVLDVNGCMFEPYVMAVQAGQTVTLRNSDAIMENFHVTSRANREFNYTFFNIGQEKQIIFSNPELFIRVKSDVHGWMFAYINVLSHPFFALTDSDGNYKLPAGLPSGSYAITAHHLKAGPARKRIQVSAGRVKELNFSIPVPASNR